MTPARISRQTISVLKRALLLAYRELIYNQRREVAFWILLAFIITFAIARLVVHTIPQVFLQVHGTHIHHFAYGIFTLAISGYLALIRKGDRTPRWLAALYGVGLALAFDEFGMWLRLTGDYYTDQSQDAIEIIILFLISVVYLAHYVRLVIRYLRK